MHLYCVDGTNLVRASSGYGGPQFREQEDSDGAWLVAVLAEVCLSAGPAVEVELFFDGPHRVWPEGKAGQAANLRVSFTRETKADDLILDRVRSHRWTGGGGVTVVTGDGELGRQAEEEGARWQQVRHGARLENVVHAMEKRFQR